MFSDLSLHPEQLQRHLTFSARLLPLLLLFSLSGCIHLPADTDYQGPQPLPAEISSYYTYPAFSGVNSTTDLLQNDTFSLKQIRLNTAGEQVADAATLQIDLYLPHRQEPSPVIMVLPILRGTVGVVRSFASYFARHGYAVVLVHRQDNLYKIEQPSQVERSLRQMVISHRLAIDWIESRPELDATRIGVFGISMGGIKAALLSGVDPRIRASVIALAAGDIPYVLVNSTENRISRIRTKLLQESGQSKAELYRQLQSVIRSDPLLLARQIDARRSLLILALYDSLVPIEKGRELRRAMGKPETIYLVSGHYSAYIYKLYVQYQSLRFFDRMLTTEPGP